MFRGFMLALLATVVLSSSAMAGGSNGGTKKDATFRIINDTSSAYAVVIDASNGLIGKLGSGTATLDDLTNEGGKIIQPGKSANFKVKAGSHRIGFAWVSSDGSDIGEPTQVTRTVGRGRTVTYNLSSLVSDALK